MRTLRFVDMLRLESALAHNTQAALNSLPNVASALVAVSVDPPLSQHDIDLLKRVYEYTPERKSLERQVTAEKEALEEQKAELRLVTRPPASGVRDAVAKQLERHKRKLDIRLSSQLKTMFAEAIYGWPSIWLKKSLAREMMSISAKEQTELLIPLERLRRQVFRSLQNFRDRLSDRSERAFGVSLPTSESDIMIDWPNTPDIYIGKIFDRNWELLSPIALMRVFGSVVQGHFLRTVPRMTGKNLSRLASQWDESIRGAMMQILSEAERRLDDLMATVERLIRIASDAAPGIRSDMDRI